MQTLGIALIVFGAFLVDSAVQNRAPIDLLKEIVKNPSQARSALVETKGTGYASSRPATTASSGTASQSFFGGTTGAAATAIAFARAQEGKPYVWGATGPNAYDCSGLVQAAWKAAGFSLWRTTYQMLAQPNLMKVSQADLIPGDLVFPDAGHVQLYIGGGQVIEAPRTGLNVRQAGMYGFFTARRIPTNNPGPNSSPNSGGTVSA